MDKFKQQTKQQSKIEVDYLRSTLKIEDPAEGTGSTEKSMRKKLKRILLGED